MRFSAKPVLSALALAALPALAVSPAAAHLPPGSYGSFAAGVTHPLFGLDHVLAMVAVGLWAARIGGRAIWAIPAAFMVAMAAGFGLAMTGAHLPAVEPMIAASVVVLGLLVAAAARLPVAVGALLVAVFAVFHGYAHGGELGEAGALRFGAGFILATGALHLVGIGLGLLLGRAETGARIGRVLGGLTAAGGLAIAFA